MPSQRIGLRFAATFRDGFGKIGEEHREPKPDRKLRDETPHRSGVKIPTVVSAAPTRVTNITGFLIISRGLSFLNESPIAGRTIFQSKSGGAFWFINSMVKKVCPLHEEMFHNRAERQRGQKIQRSDQQHSAEQNDKRAAGHRKSSGARWRIFLRASEPASAMIGIIIRKRPISMAMPSVVLYQGVLALRPAKALPLFPVPELNA